MEHTKPSKPQKHRFLRTICQELDAFENREREFLAKERKERAATLDVIQMSKKSRKLSLTVTQ